MGSYKKILVGTDGSDTSLLAVDKAGLLAADSGAELLIVTAYEPASKEDIRAASDALKEDAYQVVGSAPAESVLRNAADRARSAGATKVDTKAVQGPPVDVLDQAVADSGAELLVVGNVGLNTLTGRILGSVPQSVARRSGVDVLIVHTS
ncbi:MAG TPA: universal stress protein [Pseudonocardia sp.]|uniref:universal stress protein n=1 Tax=Pseudonocardia sp. TaxID=60912 RepID=UPI002F3EC79D